MSTHERVGQTHQVAIGNDDSGVALTTDKAMAFNIWTDMLANGFTEIWKDGATLQQSKRIILRPSTAVDPLWGSDPWHVYFEVRGSSRVPNPFYPGAGQPTNIFVSDRGLYMKVGSPTQLPAPPGTIASGLFEYPIMPDQFYSLTPDQATLIGLDDQNPRLSVRTPAAYKLTIVERGFVLATWTQALTEDTTKMGIVVVQRGVGCDGTVSSTGQKPLYLVTNVSATGSNITTGRDNNDGPRNLWFYNIIREKDTTQSRPAWITASNQVAGVNNYRYNSNLICDPDERQGQALNHFPTHWYTPVTTDTGEYIMLFPFGLCSNRFAFSDEIDLIAVSKADAYQSEQVIPLNVYGAERYYFALNSNNQHSAVEYDSGIRVFMLIENPEG